MTPHILAYDPYHTGHHSRYLEHLIRFWIDNKVACSLTIAVSPSMTLNHPYLKEMVTEAGSNDLRYMELSDDELEEIDTLSLVGKSRVHSRVLQELVLDYKPDCCLLMYFDHCQLSLATALRKVRGPIWAGIYFRPSFHYDVSLLNFRSKLTQWRKVITLLLTRRNRNLRLLFSLDSFAVPQLEKWFSSASVVALPEPAVGIYDVNRTDTVESPSELSLLCAGAIDRRKGIIHVLDALAEVDMDTSISLKIAGPIVQDREVILAAANRLQNKPGISVEIDDRYLSELEIADYIHKSDVVLLTYTNHIGSSNMLHKAAFAGTPVIGTDEGLVGRQIMQHKLGITVDSTNTSEIASAIEEMARGAYRMDYESAHQFAAKSTPLAFASTIFKSICDKAGSS